MLEAKSYWWVTMDANTHFATLKIKDRVPEPGEITNDNWQKCIFFDNEKDAKDFLKKMKTFILDNYSRAKDESWFEK